jgi:hypothetical protein
MRILIAICLLGCERTVPQVPFAETPDVSIALEGDELATFCRDEAPKQGCSRFSRCESVTTSCAPGSNGSVACDGIAICVARR